MTASLGWLGVIKPCCPRRCLTTGSSDRVRAQPFLGGSVKRRQVISVRDVRDETMWSDRGAPSAITDSAAGVPTKAGNSDTGVFWLCLINSVTFVLDQFRHIWVSQMYLYHSAPKWWQFLTCSFCHASWGHLSSNIFMLYIFGKIVEEEEGAFGLWFTYIVCAIGGSLASYFALPRHVVSLGASSAVFGLFVVGVFVKLRWSFKKLLEATILGQFVVQELLKEVQLQAAGGATTSAGQVGHIAHFGGAFVGVLLVLILRSLPDAKN